MNENPYLTLLLCISCECQVHGRESGKGLKRTVNTKVIIKLNSE
jgi:hypothetical protein